MQYMWIVLVLFYGVSKGLRDTMKKLAMNKSSMMDVLFFHSLFAFILIIPTAKDIFNINPVFYLLIFLKSLIVFLAWIFSFKSISKMPISSYGIIDVSGVVFSTLMGVFLLNEVLCFKNIIGLILVILGLYAVNFKKNYGTNDQTDSKYIFLALSACLLNAISGTMDKIYTNYVSPSQLQFWFMFYMVMLYIAYILITKSKLNIKSAAKNHWIIILSILFVIADRALFIANSYPQSKVSIMTLLKQSCVFVNIILGKIVFKEKKITYKLICSFVIIAGIMFAVS